jgi:hypothetical protein
VNNGLPNSPVYPLVFSFAVNGTNIFAGTDAGVFLSTNNGSSWTANSDLTFIQVWSLAVSGGNVFAGTWGGGVFLSKDNGASWKAVNPGLTNLFIPSLAVNNEYLFAGARNDTVWRRSIAEMTAVKLPQKPNNHHYAKCRIHYSGFLHTTVIISYTIQTSCFVELGIYTSDGKSVALLEQGNRSAGEYKIKFDGKKLFPGAYVYRFKAGSYEESDQLIIKK